MVTEPRRICILASIFLAVAMMFCSLAIPYALDWSERIMYALPRVVGSDSGSMVCAAGVPDGEFTRVISVLRAQGIMCEAGNSTKVGIPVMVPEFERENAQIILIEDASKHKYRLDLVRGT